MKKNLFDRTPDEIAALVEEKKGVPDVEPPVSEEVVEEAEEVVQEPAEEVEETKEAEEEDSKEASEEVYTPNYKFKVLDEEKEFDDFLKGTVKSKKEEEALRDLYTKAYGLDAHKKTHDSLKEKVEQHYKPLEQNYSTLNNDLQVVGQMLRKKDYRTFFDTLKIPREDILKYALDEVRYAELPPEQKQEIDRQRELVSYNENLAQQTQMYQQQMQKNATQLRALELNQELMRPEVNDLVQRFDAQSGQAGAFKDLVIKHANMRYYSDNVDLSVEQAVNEVKQKFGNFVAPVQQVPQQQLPKTQYVKPPVIPNIQGNGKSPAKRVYKSLAEIRQRKAELEDAEAS